MEISYQWANGNTTGTFFYPPCPKKGSLYVSPSRKPQISSRILLTSEKINLFQIYDSTHTLHNTRNARNFTGSGQSPNDTFKNFRQRHLKELCPHLIAIPPYCSENLSRYGFCLAKRLEMPCIATLVTFGNSRFGNVVRVLYDSPPDGMPCQIPEGRTEDKAHSYCGRRHGERLTWFSRRSEHFKQHDARPHTARLSTAAHSIRLLPHSPALALLCFNVFSRSQPALSDSHFRIHVGIEEMQSVLQALVFYVPEKRRTMA